MDNRILPKSTTFDKISAFYLDKTTTIRLTDKQELIRKRWQVAYSLIVNWEGDNEKVVELMQAQFADGENKLSTAQAYRDIRNAINLFGDVQKSTKEGIRNIINQAAYKGVSIAMENRDLDNLTKLLGLLAKNNGTDKDDPDLPDFREIQPPTQIIQINQHFITKYGDKLPPHILKQAKTVHIEAKDE